MSRSAEQWLENCAKHVKDQWRIKASEFPRPNTKLKQETGRVTLHNCLKALRKRNGVEKYYQQQTQILREFDELDALIENDHDHTQEQSPESNVIARKERIAIQVSNYANMMLFGAKIFASIKSGSLAIIASTLDSLLDLLSGFILWFTAYNMRRPNPYLYPIGKNRMQPVGILVFASVMATLGLQILIESGRRLISKDSDLELSGNKRGWIIGIMLCVSFVKFFLMLLCRAFKNEIVRAYAKDHLFDVITNVIGLIAAILAGEFQWWIDPVGAILKLTYLCWNHHQEIKQIDTVRAYTFGDHYFAEVDIVLPGEMPLRDAHDVGEGLQNKLECLPEIERAFVHVDYEVSHRPEHAGGIKVK